MNNPFIRTLQAKNSTNTKEPVYYTYFSQGDPLPLNLSPGRTNGFQKINRHMWGKKKKKRSKKKKKKTKKQDSEWSVNEN